MNKLALLFIASVFAVSAYCGEDFKHGPDSEYQEGVPKGKVEKQEPWESKIYPGTKRDWWIYVPAQYDAAKPANVMVFQDGGGPVNEKGEMRAPVVFDNLIHKKEMPVTIGIFVNPGVLAPAEPNQLPRQNRSFEYDSLGDRYATFLLREILPEVAKKYNLTKDPLGRAICGQSSGGICAFNVAWERPDAFSKVVSGIGSFTCLHGANQFPDLIRKTEPKPIRVYLQDGEKDLDIDGGSWFQANKAMDAALRWSGYDYKFETGPGGHSGRQLGTSFPDVMRWLWRDAPIEGTRPQNVDKRGVFEVLIKGEGWKRVSDRVNEGRCVATDGEGTLFISQRAGDDRTIEKLGPNGELIHWATTGRPLRAMCFGPDGLLYGVKENNLYTYDKSGKEKLFLESITPPSNQRVNTQGLIINQKGNIYFTDRDQHKIYMTDAKKSRWAYDCFAVYPRQLAFTFDQGYLVQAAYDDFQLYSFRLEPEGELTHPEPFYSLQSIEGQNQSEATGMAVDEKGRIYVTSNNGVQIFDQGGRVIGILTSPDKDLVIGLSFAGPNMDTLYYVTWSSVYARKLNAKGVQAFKPPPAVLVKPQM